MTGANEVDNNQKVAVRCSTCKKILAFKLGTVSGMIQLKCPSCKTEIRINLSCRRGKIFYRTSRIPLSVSNF